MKNYEPKHHLKNYMSHSSIHNKPLILSQRLPSALIIGAAKCGTSALVEFLSVHPQVAATDREIDFFNNDINYNKSIEWYREQMPVSNQHQITIEKTPAYLIDFKTPERVFKLNPNMKLIVIVREPYHIICIQKLIKAIIGRKKWLVIKALPTRKCYGVYSTLEMSVVCVKST